MKLFFDTKKKTMPQQVKRNEEDIETLKNKGFIVKPRGEYDEDATYHKFDLVSYDGDSYIFVSDTDAVGVPVTNGDYWQLYTSGGLNIEIGTTETLPAGSNAVVTNTGTSTDAVLNFGIPKGEQGEQGPAGQDGTDGRDGTDGVGVPSGGTTGQVLKKKSNTDYDTEWGSDESVPSGGTTGQVLKKKSNTDYDTEWANDSAGMENPMTSIGDMIYGGPTGTPTALAKGTAGQVLTMKQDETGPEWKNASGGNLYEHRIRINTSSLGAVQFKIITTRQATFTMADINTYLSTNSTLLYTMLHMKTSTNNINIASYIESGSSYPKLDYERISLALNDTTIEPTITSSSESLSSGSLLGDSVIQIL